MAEAAFRPLGLDNRAINALVRGGVFSLEELSRLTEARARAISGLGPKTISQIRSYLKAGDPAATEPWEERTVATRFDARTIADIDLWLDTQAAVSSRASAIRHLVAHALRTIRSTG